MAKGEAVAIGPIEISRRIVGEGGESVSVGFNFVVVLLILWRVELSSHLGLCVWDIVRARPSGIVDDDFGLVLAPQLERPARGLQFGIVLARSDRVGGLLVAALSSAKAPVLTSFVPA